MTWAQWLTLDREAPWQRRPGHPDRPTRTVVAPQRGAGLPAGRARQSRDRAAQNSSRSENKMFHLIQIQTSVSPRWLGDKTARDITGPVKNARRTTGGKWCCEMRTDVWKGTQIKTSGIIKMRSNQRSRVKYSAEFIRSFYYFRCIYSCGCLLLSYILIFIYTS